MRSDNVTKGSERAPNRSLFYALGYTPEELERPLIGVVSAYSEIVDILREHEYDVSTFELWNGKKVDNTSVSYTHLRAHET